VLATNETIAHSQVGNWEVSDVPKFALAEIADDKSITRGTYDQVARSFVCWSIRLSTTLAQFEIHHSLFRAVVSKSVKSKLMLLFK